MSDLTRVRGVFADAIELGMGQRAAFLDRACAGDAPLRDAVEALLRADSSAVHFLENPITLDTDALTTPEQRPSETPTQLGPYRIVERLGSGGMGEVFLAEQSEPVKRRVALKLIKRGMDSEQVLARFNSEKHALALMDHPCIAAVLDAGVSPDNRPFFVMQHVSGDPITTFCDRVRMPIRERVRLMIQVCQAIQHAHQKGIIHRDVKPSNVLVSAPDGKPTPKVIDFGVAKAVDSRSGLDAGHTEVGQLIGTPEYMSPEQAALSPLNIDTRTDIYSLGVLLYELLTGTLPLERGALRRLDFDQLCRAIREQTPPRPSARLRTLSTASAQPSPTDRPSLSEIAINRASEPAPLRRQLEGDLDWIVLKALEKERARRYDSAGALARDLERFLEDEPVSAGPPSAVYRVRKFVARHRVGVVAAGLVLVALLAGIAGTTWGLIEAGRQAWRATKQAERADLAYAGEQKARQLAEAEAANARYVARTAREQALYMARQLGQLMPTIRRGLDLAHFAPAPLRADYPGDAMSPVQAQLDALLPEFFASTPDPAPIVEGVSSLIAGRASLAEKKQVAEWISRHAEPIDRLVEMSRSISFLSGADYSSVDPKADTSTLASLILPQVQPLMRCQRMLCAAALVRHARGDAAGATECLRAARRVALSIGYGGTTLSTLCDYVGHVGIYSCYRVMVVDAAERGPIPDEYAHLLDFDPPAPGPEMALIFEGLTLRQIIADVFVPDAGGTPRLAPERLRAYLQGAAANASELTNSNYEAVLRGLSEYEDAVRGLGRSVGGSVKSSAEPRFANALARDPLLRWIIGDDGSDNSGSFPRIYLAYQRALAERDAAIITLALARHRVRMSVWPASLDEVLPNALPQPSRLTYFSAPLSYSLVNGQPQLSHPGPGGQAASRAPLSDSPASASDRTDWVFIAPDDPRRPDASWILPR
ncbi:MAG: serine/threonine-protein kinase [Phycisphaerae bacterium]